MTLLDLEHELGKATVMFMSRVDRQKGEGVQEFLAAVKEHCRQLKTAAVAMVSPELTLQIAEMEAGAERYNADWKAWRRERDDIIAEAVKTEREACAEAIQGAGRGVPNFGRNQFAEVIRSRK